MVKHNDICIAWRGDGNVAFIWKERASGARWELFTTGYDAYLLGRKAPHYPVPATIGETFILDWIVYITDIDCTLRVKEWIAD